MGPLMIGRGLFFSSLLIILSNICFVFSSQSLMAISAVSTL